MNKMELITAPVIKHDMVAIGKTVDARLKKLNVSGLVVTEDTIQSLKALRAELNKEFTGYEAQRKALKQAVANPYMEFEAIFKAEIGEKFKKATDELKDKIGDFEIKLKVEKKDNVLRYFTELCAAEEIGFLKFSDLNLNITLSVSEKKYKEQCNAFVERVKDDLMLIQTSEYEAEVMTEYKKTLSASKALTEVKERKDAEKMEKARIKLNMIQKRTALLSSIGVFFHAMTKTYNWIEDDAFYITEAHVESLSDEDFRDNFVEMEAAIKEQMGKKAPTPVEEPTPTQPEPIKKPILKAPLKAPTVKAPIAKKAEIFKANFVCEGTMTQLKALGQYMKDNSITYKNIE